MLSISQTIINELQRYNVDPLLNLIDEYQQKRLCTFLTFEGERITHINKRFKNNMKRILNQFLIDSVAHMEKRLNTGTPTERMHAKRAHVTVEQLAHIFIPKYFDLRALVRLAKHLSHRIPDYVAFLAMKATENLPFEATQEDASDYFDDWMCSIYLDECSDYNSSYKPFSNFAPNYKNCFTAWIFRCFEDNLTDWLVNAFNALYEEFKTKCPNLFYAFCCTMQQK